MKEQKIKTPQDAIWELMKKTGIKEADIVRNTGLSQARINLLLRGSTEFPRIDTLYPIARYFNVPMEYFMIGEDAFENKRAEKLKQINDRIEGTSFLIPLIEWSQVKHWLLNGCDEIPGDIHTVAVKNISKQSYALTVTALMKPAFNNSSIIIVDYDRTSCGLKDNTIVIVSQKGNIPTARQVIRDSGNYYLRLVHRPSGADLFNKDEYILMGEVVETRTTVVK